MKFNGAKLQKPQKICAISIVYRLKQNQDRRSARLAVGVVTMVHWYQVRMCGDLVTSPTKQIEIERVQTGVRMERRVLKVLKALAEYKNMTLGDLLEGIVLHAFDGKLPFSAETLRKVAELKGIYELDLDAGASHRLKEKA
jgi:hypothetical protein